MKTTVAITIDTDDLRGLTDEYLAQLWHVAQANPAPFGDKDACELVERIGYEIVRRFLQQSPSLYNHQQAHRWKVYVEKYKAKPSELAEPLPPDH